MREREPVWRLQCLPASPLQTLPAPPPAASIPLPFSSPSIALAFLPLFSLLRFLYSLPSCSQIPPSLRLRCFCSPPLACCPCRQQGLLSRLLDRESEEMAMTCSAASGHPDASRRATCRTQPTARKRTSKRSRKRSRKRTRCCTNHEMALMAVVFTQQHYIRAGICPDIRWCLTRCSTLVICMASSRVGATMTA